MNIIKLIMKSFGLLLAVLIFSTGAHADTKISYFKSKFFDIAALPADQINNIIKSNFNVNQYRVVKLQVIANNNYIPDHILVFLFSKKQHHVDVARINIDNKFQAKSITNNYRL